MQNGCGWFGSEIGCEILKLHIDRGLERDKSFWLQCITISCVLVQFLVHVHCTYIWYPPPQDQYFRAIYCYLRYFVVFFLCLNVCVFLAFFYIFKKLCRVVKALPLIKLFSFNRMIFTKPRENQKTKTFQRMFGLRLMFGFFGFPRVFLVFLVMTLKKLKNSRFFWFFG